MSIVTHKAQTTRQNVRFVKNTKNSQIIFTDTPGVEASVKSTLCKHLNKNSQISTFDADLIVFITTVSSWNTNDEVVLNNIKRAKIPAILVINKTDRLKNQNEILPIINNLKEKHDFVDILAISALKESSMNSFLNVIEKHLPEQEPLFTTDSQTEPDDSFVISERIRESLLKNLHQEIPYESTVQVEKIEDLDHIKKIHVVIWVNTEGQKRIVIGKGGEVLKNIGKSSRIDLEKYFSRKIHLALWVKIKSSWWENQNFIDKTKI